MKKALLFAASAALILASCAKEETTEVAPEVTPQTAGSALTVLTPASVSTKTDYTAGGRKAAFTKGVDSIGLYLTTGTSYTLANLHYKATNTTTTHDGAEYVLFGYEGKINLNDYLEILDQAYAYYPYNSGKLTVEGAVPGTRAASWDGTHTVQVPSTQEAKGSSEYENPDLTNVGKYEPLIANPTAVQYKDGNYTVDLSFEHPFSLNIIAVKNGTGHEVTVKSINFASSNTSDALTGNFTADLKNVTVSPVSGETSNAVTVKLTEPVTLAADAVTYVPVVITAGTFTSPTFTVSTETGTYKQTVADVTTKAGYINALAVTITDADLGDWKKVTSANELTSGDYVLVYPAGDGKYNVFSFEQSMENAKGVVDLAYSVSDIRELLGEKGTDIFKGCVGGNYITVDSDNADYLDISSADESKVKMTAETAEGVTGEGSATLYSTTGNLGIKRIVVKLADGNSVNIAAQFNAADINSLLTTLRGKSITVTVGGVIDYVCKRIVSVGDHQPLSDEAIANIKNAFTEICTKLNISDKVTLETPVMNLVVSYYNTAADFSYDKYSADKAFGWIKPFGFYKDDNGFSFHVPAPNEVWFDRLSESLQFGEKLSSTMGTKWTTKDGFTAYWANFDSTYPQYTQALQRMLLSFAKTDEEKESIESITVSTVAAAAVNNKYITESTLEQIAAYDWANAGTVYKNAVGRLNNDPLEKVYLYKKVTK